MTPLDVARAFDVATTPTEVRAIYESLRGQWPSLTIDQKRSIQAHRDESLARVDREIAALAAAMREDDAPAL